MVRRFDEVKAQVRLADQLGFSDLLTGMHYAGAPLQQYQLIPMLARLMAETERMRIITGIILLSLHKPLDMAEQLATLSLKPVQQPMPPIWLGANADSAVRRAARLADAWFINPHQRMDTIERQLSIYRQTLAEFNKPPPQELPLMREIFVARSRDEAVRLARPYLEEKYKVYHEWGQQKAMPQGDNQLDLAFDDLVRDRFLLGSPDEVAEQIIGYNRRLGVNRMILSVHWVGMPHAQVVDTLHLFAAEVMPKVKQGL
jgi:alkanesulfonate monooxygenase SsuD/methylene tetrahydromethanopterin reductase-like flavin-dependent oxidoreductase (luciferase family)